MDGLVQDLRGGLARLGLEERGVHTPELQEAVKYGRQMRANPGRDGKIRWRYIHKGFVYITDETRRHEITSWRLADALEEVPRRPLRSDAGADGASHVVVIVDHSASMRRNDVPGYNSRTAAVYDCLARDLIEPQLRKPGVGRMEVSVIEMSRRATVVQKRAMPDAALLAFLKRRMSSRARSNGNYLPALEAARRLLARDAGRSNQLFLVLLSDGSPSDHVGARCVHGNRPWEPYYARKHSKKRGRKYKGRKVGRRRRCLRPEECRQMVYQQLLKDCVAGVTLIGDLLGRDRVFVSTVAFGPRNEDYSVLEKMAEALPRHSFQKLGLSAACLRTAFTSLTASLTSLRTEASDQPQHHGAGGSSSLTLRSDIAEVVARQSYEERDLIGDGLVWELYCGYQLVQKRRYDAAVRCMVIEPFTSAEPVRTWRREQPGVQEGVAHATKAFAQGSERDVYQFTEVVSFDDGLTGMCVGLRLVAKSSVYAEDLDSPEFNLQFCKNAAEAEELAKLFNWRLQGGPEWQVHFLPCYVYTILDGGRYSRTGQLQILVQQELEGRVIKWNNHAGGVTETTLVPAAATAAAASSKNTGMDAIEERDDGESSDSHDYSEYGSEYGAGPVDDPALAEHVPQCFSHFTYCVTDGDQLVCDLQGVWNPVDGFMLTDPVIHHKAKSEGDTRATDKGQRGITSFFSTHICNPLCRRLGLEPVAA